MPNVCFYFQVHQPYRLKDLRITDIGHGETQYFDDQKNHAVFRKVAEKCYVPANHLILQMIKCNPNVRVSYSLSGVFLDQCREYGQDVLDSFKALAATGNVEFLAETYYHSLSALFSLEEFCAQVQKHVKLVQELFGVTPTIFRNTELVYNNEIAHIVRLLGFTGILAEGADKIMHGRTPNVPYVPPSFTLPKQTQAIIRKYRVHKKPADQIKILLKNYRLSDDIAFRFGNRGWNEFPLHADKFADWVNVSADHSINLFMDYETFGEHQWADTGIFHFLEALPHQFAQRGIGMRTPSEIIQTWSDRFTPTLDAHCHVSWADLERDLSAWRGNELQEAALAGIYGLEQLVKATGNEQLLDTWRKLQTSDHFYYLCTKYFSDGDVHKYFSPYESPYEGYRRYSHALEDLRFKLAGVQIADPSKKSPRVSRARSQKTESKAPSTKKTKVVATRRSSSASRSTRKR